MTYWTNSPNVQSNHDDVIKWKHFSAQLAYVRGIHRSPVNSPHNGQWRGALVFSMVCAWINALVNDTEAGDLRLHRAHYDVTVMHTVIPYPHISIVRFSINLTAPWRYGCNINSVIFKLISRADIWGMSWEIALRWIPQDLTDDLSTLVQWYNVDQVFLRHMASLDHDGLKSLRYSKTPWSLECAGVYFDILSIWNWTQIPLYPIKAKSIITYIHRIC